MDHVVAVQSQPSDLDTDWLLGLANAEVRIAGVVGWMDLLALGAPARIAALASHPKLCGLRPMLQDLSDDDWILQPELEPAIEAMLAHGLCFEALVRPRHLFHLLRFAERYPQLPIVIDHAAKPEIARGVRDAWWAQMAALAEQPQVFCKLSGLLTEAGADWHERDLGPCVDHLLAIFGPQRLLWGSDWPVLNLAADYERWFRLVAKLTKLRREEHAALFGGNAIRFYGLASKEGVASCA